MEKVKLFPCFTQMQDGLEKLKLVLKLKTLLGGYFSHETMIFLIHKTMQMTPQADFKSY
jgi:hypothetical protein